jgi:hypothetical protein
MAIPTPKVEIGFDLTDSPIGPFFRLDDPVAGKLDNTDYRLGGTIFYDVTDRVRSIRTTRGKPRRFTTFPAGNAAVEFNNHDRAFDPLYAESPFAGNIVPRREIRVSSNPTIVNAVTNTNFATNPSFEGQSLVTTTNISTNPSFGTDTTGWTLSGGTSFTRVTSDSVFGSACGQLVATAAGNLAYNQVTTTASQTYTYSAYVKGEVGKTFRINLEERTASASVGLTVGSTITANGTWQRVSVTRTFGATGVIARLIIENRQAGSHTILIDGVLFTQSATTLTYFDGNTTGVNDTTFAWTGTANNSSSTEQSNAVVSVRRNLASNPSIELNTTTIGASRMTVTLDTTTKYFGNQALRATVNSTAGIQYIDAQLYPVTAGLPYTASVYLFMPLTNSSDRTVRIELHPHTGSGYLARMDGNLNISVPRGQWVRITASGTAPATAVSVLMRLVPTTTLALNDVMIVDGYLLEQSTTLGEYFDGNFGNDGDYDYRWAGVIGNSTSEQLVRQIVGSSASTNSAAGMSRAWDATGVRSLLVAPNASNNDSHIRFSFSGLTNGATYTALVKCRLSASLTGTLNARSRQISAWDSTFTTNAGSATAPNTAGEHDLRFTFTANDTTMIIALHNGASVNNGFVWFDDFALVDGDYDGPYFDGYSVPTNPYLNYAWSGTVNASTSTRTQDGYVAGQIFTGWIDDWNLTYTPDGNSLADAVALDATTIFSSQTLSAGTPTVQLTGSRVNEILDEAAVNWAAELRAIDTGTVNAGAQVIEAGTNALTYLQNIASTEAGLFFIGKDGKVIFRNRRQFPTSADLVTFSQGTGIPYAAIGIVYGAELLFNEVTIANQGGGTAVATDNTSVGTYGKRELVQTDLLGATDAQSIDLAIHYADLYSAPEYRVETLELDLHKLNSSQQNQVLNLEIGSVCEVSFTPNNIGDPIQRYIQIIRIEHSITPSFHKTTLGFQEVKYVALILDDAVFGKLDVASLG